MIKKIKKLSIRLITIAGLISIYITGNILLESLEKKYQQPKTFIFKLPLPDDIKIRYGIPKKTVIKIKKVIITGYFAEWSQILDIYRMKQTASDTWQIKFKLPPGENSYKFVLFTKKKYYDRRDKEWRDTIWVHDTSHNNKIDDGFGGYNSVAEVQSIRNVVFIFDLLLIGLIIVMTLFIILEPIIHYIMHLKKTFRTKLIVNVILIGIVSNIVFIVYNLYEQRETIKEVFLQSINMVHNHLRSKKVDFLKLDTPQQKAYIKKTMSAFLEESTIRSEKMHYSNRQININYVLLYSTNFTPLTLGTRKDAIKKDLPRAVEFGFQTITSYYHNLSLPSIRLYKKKAWFSSGPFFGKQPRSLRLKNDGNRPGLLGYNVMIPDLPV